MTETFEFKGKVYDVSWKSEDTRHGGPFDRGSADSYYGRRPVPHYFVAGTHTSPEVTEDQMTKEQIDAYWAGYEYNELHGDKKDWG